MNLHFLTIFVYHWSFLSNFHCNNNYRLHRDSYYYIFCRFNIIFDLYKLLTIVNACWIINHILCCKCNKEIYWINYVFKQSFSFMWKFSYLQQCHYFFYHEHMILISCFCDLLVVKLMRTIWFNHNLYKYVSKTLIISYSYLFHKLPKIWK